MTSSASGRYLTLAGDAEVEIEVKRSRFLATLRRVEDEAAARAVVEELRKRHWDARHHCSAFVLGADAMVQRSSDDGEPAGTAGAPMLEVLRGHDVSDVVAVVTRWFGGVLLGAGGLVRAYGDAVREGLAAAGTRQRELRQEFALTLPHADAARLENDLRTRGTVVIGTDYGVAATLRVAVPASESQQFGPLIASLTAGAARLVEGDRLWVDLPPG